jgi:UDP-N-acetyl-D-mannosaminuronic acid dehydrogenase
MGAPPDAPISILGLAFKGIPETDDLRGSMSLRVIDELKSLRPTARLRAFDPVVKREAIEALGLELEVCEQLPDTIAGAHAVVITNNHPLFESLGVAGVTRGIAPGAFVYDFWNHFSLLNLHLNDTDYFAVGSARSQPA